MAPWIPSATPRGHTETFVDPGTVPAVPDGSVHPAPVQLPSRGLGRPTSSLRGQHHPTAWDTPARSWACRRPGRWVFKWTGDWTLLVAKSVHQHLPDPFPETAEPGIRPPQARTPPTEGMLSSSHPSPTSLWSHLSACLRLALRFLQVPGGRGGDGTAGEPGPRQSPPAQGRLCRGFPVFGPGHGDHWTEVQDGNRICPPWGSCPARVCAH